MDVVVTVPKRLWAEWLAEGDAAGDKPKWDMYIFWLGQAKPRIQIGERVYVVAHGKLRGYAPLVQIAYESREPGSRLGLVRSGGAVAATIPEAIPGFRGFRYRWWEREEEIPFPDWRTP